MLLSEAEPYSQTIKVLTLMLTPEQFQDIQARVTAARARINDGQGDAMSDQAVSLVEDAERLLVELEALTKEKAASERYAQDFYQAATRYQTSWNQLSALVQRYFESSSAAIQNAAYRELAELLGLPVWDGD